MRRSEVSSWEGWEGEGLGPHCIHKLTSHTPLTNKVLASCKIELGDIHLLEYLDVPWGETKWNVK